MKRHGWLITIAAAAAWFFFSTSAGAQAPPPVEPPEWSKESVKLFQHLPVQEGGRIKPMETVARVKLIKFNGMSMFRAGKTLRTPTEWLMDCLFFPDRASQYKTFIVDSAEVMDALGLPHENKRDRYAFVDLAPAKAKLYELGEQYAHKEPKDRSTVETQLVNLAENFSEFDQLIGFMESVRRDYPVAGIAAFGGKDRAPLSEIVRQVPALTQTLMKLGQDPAGANTPEAQAINHLFHEIDQTLGRSDALALIPPPQDAPVLAEWQTPAGLVNEAFTTGSAAPDRLALLESLERMARSSGDAIAFAQSTKDFSSAVVGLAQARGEYRGVGLEVFYHNFRFMGLAVFYTLVQYLYVLAFLAMALLWLLPRNRAMAYVVPVLLAIPTGLLVWGITLRCLIRMRPPVTTLYETILFITAVAVIVALAIEYMNRQRIALSMAAVLGALGVFLANKYEIKEGADTMPSMVAVLDTNFWLSTHVTTIVIGYAAGLLAGAIAHVFVFAKLLGLKRHDPEFYRSITRMVYGVLCFGLFFSMLGTVLGGIWANESWGRFWGWDPKENGALLICLWGLLVLHARLGGYIRDYGINLAAIVGGMIVAFSWFGVNLLGVGLHSYGFTSGIFTTLVAFYAVETLMVFAGFGAWMWDLSARMPAVEEPQQGQQPTV